MGSVSSIAWAPSRRVDAAPHDSTEHADQDPAQSIASRFVDCCFDADGNPTELAATLLQRFREMQYQYVGEAEHKDRKSNTYPPGAVHNDHAYGECCLVAADALESTLGEMIIIRRDPNANNQSSGDAWLVYCYQLQTAREARVPVKRAVVTEQQGGQKFSLQIDREPDHAHQNTNDVWLTFTRNDDGYADDGASVSLPEWSAHGHRDVRQYTVDFADVRTAIVEALKKQLPDDPEKLLSQPWPIERSQLGTGALAA